MYVLNLKIIQIHHWEIIHIKAVKLHVHVPQIVVTNILNWVMEKKHVSVVVTVKTKVNTNL